MPKTILITGATDGIGLETAKMLSALGHTVLLHGRNAAKLADVMEILRAQPGAGTVEGYVADLSSMADVEALARDVVAAHPKLESGSGSSPHAGYGGGGGGPPEN